MRRLFLALTALLLLPTLSAPTPAVHAQSGRQVLIFYYAWFEKSSWNDPWFGDRPTEKYSSGDRDTMLRQIKQIEAAGIDGVICTWYGKTLENDAKNLTKRCTQLMDLIEETGSNLKVATIADQFADETGELRNPDNMISALRYAEQQWFNRPSYMQRDGKPVVVFWNMPTLGSRDTFKTIRDATDPDRKWFWLSEGTDFNYLDVADAQYFYDITAFEPAKSMQNYRDLLEAYNKSHNANKPFVATVMPGYDDTRAADPGRGRVRDRENGEYYKRSWKAANDNNAALTVITSWNEFAEGHHIEPSDNYGELYLNLTTELVPAYKSGQPAPAPSNPPPPSAPQPSGAFADTAFESVWQRADRAVAEQQASRSWIWGPQPATNGLQEAFNGGTRLVQYFDKSRMEINNPNGDRTSPWFVTNGLLVRELISGRMQTGDASFEERAPASEPLAGDPPGANAIAPTYASLRTLIDQPATNRVGQVVNEGLSKDGQSSTLQPPAQARYAVFVEETDHNIPDVFWNYMNSRGPVYEGGRYQQGQVVDWLFAFGYPIGEAYWIVAKVGGVDTSVLVQPFERRILTYVPSNPAAFQVEMGNVGQHYYRWRYNK